jgi:hypothetical protein
MTTPIPGIVTAAATPSYGPPSALLGPALKSLLDRQEANAKAASYYEGDRAELFASVRMRRAMLRTGIGFRFNFAKTPVDALTDRLEIASVTSTSDRANAGLAEMWQANQLDLEIPDIHRRAGEFGDAYVMVWPREDNYDDMADEGTEPGPTPADVGIYYNSSDTVQLFYDAENPLKKHFAVKRWKTEDKRWRLDLLFAERIERYLSKTGTTGQDAKDFEPLVLDYDYIEGDNGELISFPVWPIENPYGEVPVFHLRNDRPYGCPEHKGFYGPQDAITKLIVSHMAGVDYQSFPQRYALVEGDSDTSEAADLDEDDFTFSTEGENDSTTASATGEGRSQFTSDPGSLWYMRGVKGVGQFETADPDTFLKPMDRYLRFGAQITGTPLRMFDYESSQMPSGASQSQADGPFVKKVRNRQLSYGATWQDIFQFGLRLAGIEGVEVTVAWAPPTVVDDEAGWNVIKLKLEAGVPFEQVMREAGYMRDQLEAWAKEAKPSTTDPLEALKLQADALGVLVRLGASPESAAKVLGLDGLQFTGAVPVTLRIPEDDAVGLEEK